VLHFPVLPFPPLHFWPRLCHKLQYHKFQSRIFSAPGCIMLFQYSMSASQHLQGHSNICFTAGICWYFPSEQLTKTERCFADCASEQTAFAFCVLNDCARLDSNLIWLTNIAYTIPLWVGWCVKTCVECNVGVVTNSQLIWTDVSLLTLADFDLVQKHCQNFCWICSLYIDLTETFQYCVCVAFLSRDVV